MKKRISVVMLALFVLASLCSASWTGPNASRPYTSMSFVNDVAGVGLTNGVVYVHTGLSTTNAYTNVRARCVYMVSTTKVLVGLGDPAAVVVLTYNGSSWGVSSTTTIQFALVRDHSMVNSLAAKDGVVLAAGDSSNQRLTGLDGFMIRSTDVGATWSVPMTGFDKLNSVGFQANSIAIAVGEQGVNVRTTDAGLTWTTLPALPVLRLTNGDGTAFGGRSIASGLRPSDIASFYENLEFTYGNEKARRMLDGKIESNDNPLALSKALVISFDVDGNFNLEFIDVDAYTSTAYDVAKTPMGTFEIATQRMEVQGGQSLPFLLLTDSEGGYSVAWTGGSDAEMVQCIERPSISAAWASGPFGLIWTDAPLPVQLARFIAVSVTSAAVRFEWTTVSETNCYGFYLEKTAGGTGNFVEVQNSFVAGHGTTLQVHNYTWTESNPLPGQWQYRLRIQDLDGSVQYSGTVSVAVLTGVVEKAIPTEFALKQNYPNPFNPATTITYSLAAAGQVNLVVFNTAGQKIATLINETQPAGTYSPQFNAANLPSGVYLYRLQAGPFVEARKMLLMK